MTTRREKLRQAAVEEIKSIAWKSLRENQPVTIHRITREMGMTAPAFYTYFKNRDALMGQLVSDALDSFYQSLAAPDEKDTGLRSLFMRYRGWATDHPYAFSLFAGPPVFGLDANQYPKRAEDIYRLVLDFFHRADRGRAVSPDIRTLDPLYVDALKSIRDRIYPVLDISRLHCAVTLMIQTHGSISLELSTRFNPMINDWQTLFRTQIDSQLTLFGF